VEDKVSEALGPDALREAQAAPSSVMATSYQGRFDSGGPRVNIVLRRPSGWFGWKSGRAAPLTDASSRALDLLLASPALWREAPFYPEMDCPDAGATMMVIRHKAQTRVTRQGCSPAGFTGRLEELVLTESAAP